MTSSCLPILRSSIPSRSKPRSECSIKRLLLAGMWRLFHERWLPLTRNYEQVHEPLANLFSTFTIFKFDRDRGGRWSFVGASMTKSPWFSFETWSCLICEQARSTVDCEQLQAMIAHLEKAREQDRQRIELLEAERDSYLAALYRWSRSQITDEQLERWANETPEGDSFERVRVVLGIN